MFGGYMPLPIRLGHTRGEEDWTAEQHARMAADLVGFVQVAPFALITLDIDPGVAPTLVGYNGMHGVGAGAAPAIALTATGAEITWNRSYQDPYETASFFQIRHAKATAHGTTARTPRVDVTAHNVIEVTVSNSAGTAIASRVTVKVY